MMLCSLHSLFTGVSWTCIGDRKNGQSCKQSTIVARRRDRGRVTYDELVLVHFGAGEQGEREAAEEEE
jgi:hypothetical protein